MKLTIYESDNEEMNLHRDGDDALCEDDEPAILKHVHPVY